MNTPVVEKYNEFLNTLSNYDEQRVFIVGVGITGMGDKLTTLPAFRHLKKLYPKSKIVLHTDPFGVDVYKACKYIDYIIPEGYIKSPENFIVRKDIDIGIIAAWSFEQHHQKHITKSGVEYICNIEKYTDDIPLEYEFEYRDCDIDFSSDLINELKFAAKDKPIVGIAPAYTMFSRMWSEGQWAKLTDKLKEAGYYVVALGGNNDLKIRNVHEDLCGQIPIRALPIVLNSFEHVITLNSGMLHLASVNPDVNIIYLSVGQFPPELIAPYRKGKLFHNMTVIEHNCPMKDSCFHGHITETNIRPQITQFLDNYKWETGKEFPRERIELAKKYVCWHYCAKLKDKYSCRRLITPEMVMEAIKK